MYKIFCFVLISCVCYSCSYKPYFKTPNDVSEMKATVYLNNGTVLNGLLSIVFENDMTEGKIYLLSDSSHTKQWLNIKDIQSYTIDGNVYLPKLVDLYMMGTYHFLFVKRLTSDSDKMQLYNLHQLFKSNVVGEEADYYFFSFPYFSRYEVVDINSTKVVPNFDNKMSYYVQDCPSLAERIRNKESSYYYNLLAFRSKKEEVIKKIVKAYNECK